VSAQVHAAAVSPTDILDPGGRDGSRAEQKACDPPPCVPCMDARGIVDEVGQGKALERGTRRIST